MANAAFGEQRLLRGNAAERALFRTLGVADPAHYLHYRYLRRMLTRMGSFAPCQILDAGCGAGDHTLYLARRFPSARVVGVDVDATRIADNTDVARRLGLRNLAFRVENLTMLEDREEYDLIVSIDVLEHIPEQVRVIHRLRRALRPGGFGFFHLPTLREQPVPFSRHLKSFHAWAEREHLADERTWEEFVDLVEQAGFAIVQCVRTFGYYTGELATSLFAIPHADTPRNRVAQALLAPACRILALADLMMLERTRYGAALMVRRPRD